MFAMINSIKRWLSQQPCLAPDNDPTTLHFAAWTGNLNAINLSLSSGINAGLRDPDDFTALHLAVFNMHAEAVKMLLEANSTVVNMRNKMCFTALEYAVFHHDVELVKLLLAIGADPSLTDGSTA